MGLVFDSKLTWDEQVTKAVQGANKSLQALKIISKYFTQKEMVKLVTAFFYSKLYYNSQVWLIPSLKQDLKNKLNSVSGRALRICHQNKNITSIKTLHKDTNRATVKMWLDYCHAILLYDTIKKEIPEEEWIGLQLLQQNNRRSEFIYLTSNENYRVGKNKISNRLDQLSGKIKYTDLDMTRDSFKKKYKTLFIEEELKKL